MNEMERVHDPDARKSKITTVVIVALIIFSGIYLFWEYFLGVKPDIKINGTKVSIGDSVQDLLDNGFVLCDFNGKVRKDLDFTLTGKQIYNTKYYIGVPYYSGGSYSHSTGVAITVANFNNSKKSFEDCTIYQMAYYPNSQDGGVEVLVNGEDLREASFDAWLEFLEEVGYPFKKADLDELRRGDKMLIFGKRGRYQFEVNADSYYNEKTIYSLTFTNNVKVTYKSR